jgi:hypothetical protein
MDSWSQFMDSWSQFMDSWSQFMDSWSQFMDSWSQFMDSWSQFMDSRSQFMDSWSQNMDSRSQITDSRSQITNSRSQITDSCLDPFDCREPGRCAVSVESRLKPVRFDGGEIPSSTGVERRSQLFLRNGVRAGIGTIVAEAQHVQGSVVRGHRRQASHISWTLLAVEGVEQSAVQHRLERSPQALQMERINRGKLNLDPAVPGLLSGHCQCRLRHVNAQNLQSQRGDVKSVLAGPAARIEHRSGESAFGCQTHDCRLRPANIPGRRAVVVRRIPRQSRHPFVTGWVPATERIVSEGS